MTQAIQIGDDPTVEDEKKKITTPPIMQEAADAASNLIGDTGPNAKQAYDYYTQPFKQDLAAQQASTNRQFEAQGLRFSGERYDPSVAPTTRGGTMQQNIENTYRRIGESVVVPLEMQRQADIRAGIQTATGVGAQQAAIDQWAQQFGFNKEQFSESVRQWDTATEIQKEPVRRSART
jgi:hypothetical protein